MIREAIILAGGRGTRLRAVIADRPKPLAPVAGRPFVEWLLLALRRQGVGRAILAAGHQGEVLREHLGGRKDLGLEIIISQEPIPLGTGGAARHALRHVTSAQVAVLNGDSYCPFDLRQLAAAAPPGQASALWLVPSDDCARYGRVELGPEGRVAAFTEKAPHLGGGLINAGVYVFNRQELASIPPGRPVSLEREVLPLLRARGLFGVMGSGPFLDIGTPESYRAAAEFLRGAFADLLAA